MSRERVSNANGSGVTAKRGGSTSGTDTTQSSASEQIAGTTTKAASAAEPLQPSALAQGSERGPPPCGAKSQANPDVLVGQQDPLERSPVEATVRTSATPAASPAFSRTTHAPHVALPGRMAFAAAIHSASANRAPMGGRMPRSRAQTRRWCGVWQQHAVQHSVALAQPQPQSWQGYGVADAAEIPNSLPKVAGAGITPNVAIAMTTIITIPNARRTFRETRECKPKTDIERSK